MKCTINGLEINYQVRGSGFPLVMIHGYSLDHHVMTGCMEPILNPMQGFKRIYFDLPGMGKTPASVTIRNSQDMLEVIVQFIETLIPDQRFAVVGQSYGGYLARGVTHLLRNQVEGMLLICPVKDFTRSMRRVPNLVVLERDDELLAELSMLDAEDFISCVVLQNRQVWNRFSRDILPGVRLADFSLLERLRDTEFSFDPDSQGSTYTKPVCILLARFDNSVGYRDGMDLFNYYPRASLMIADRAGHNLQFEQEDLFNSAVKVWLTDIDRS